jgi:2'-5' RNA ligase
MIERWRSFIAFTPGQALNKKVQGLVRTLGPECDEAGHKVRWVHPGKVHLTLRFLGDVPVPLALSLEDALRPLSGIERFHIEYTGLGAFPDTSRPRVIWMGVSDPDGRLHALHARLSGILEQQGIPAEKRDYTPHITIGRVKRTGQEDLAPLLESCSREGFGEEVVAGIVFYRSILDPRGAQHEPRWAVSLGRERSGRRSGE